MTLQRFRKRRRLTAALTAAALMGSGILGCGSHNPVEPNVSTQQETISKSPVSLATSCVAYKGFYCGECTWLAAREFDNTAPWPGVNWHGDAGTWDVNAWNTGWQVWWACPDPNNTTAMNRLEGGIVVWSGHVAFIKHGGPDGLLVYEQNWPRGAGPTFRTLSWPTVYNRSGQQLKGFILRTRR